jgi:putative peptide zinc metalloprotease protein
MVLSIGVDYKSGTGWGSCMAGTFSSSWYRVASFKPQLRNHFEIYRQPYGKQITYLLQDQSSGKIFRFNEAAYELIGRLDGKQTLHEIWEVLLVVMQDDAPTQDEVIGILSRLHKADALQGNLPPDCLDMFRRDEKQRRKKWLNKLRSPFSIKVPLFDPDKLLEAILPIAGCLFTPLGFIVWLAVVVTAIFAAAPEWQALKEYASLNMLETNNLVVLGLVYPLVKVIHEFGHAISTKKWGGEVHEMGISLLVFIPVPYVDASSSVVCRYKYQRMIVSAAGMMVEVFLASLALFVWLNIEDSATRSIAFNIMVIAGVSTLVFNGNPLLRFDAYYILEDLIEVPNLASRSSRYLLYLIQRYLFQLKGAVSPLGRVDERAWLITYGLISTIYRWFIMVVIIWFVAGQFFVFGIILAVWAIVAQILLPIWKGISFILIDPRLQKRRLYSVTVSSGLLAIFIYVFCIVPIPSITRSEGVLLPPEDALLKATGEGFVTQVYVTPLANVDEGQSLIELDAPLVRSQLDVIKAEMNELKVRHRIAKSTDLFAARLYEEQFEAKQAELDQMQERVGELVIKSPSDGRFLPLDYSRIKNLYIKKGDTLGYVVGKNPFTVKTAITQDRIGLFREGIKDVSVVLANDMDKTYPARVIRAVPAAMDTLPSNVLGKFGGGKITVDPDDKEGIRTINSVFNYEIALESERQDLPIGLRVYIRFNHGDMPLLAQCYRHVRQLFLGRFGV